MGCIYYSSNHITNFEIPHEQLATSKMRSAFAPLALAALASATPMPQAGSSAAADCSSSYHGEFMIQVVNVTSSAKRSVQKRQDKVLTMTLQNGVLKDDEGRTGYIASNNQFQFDAPPQVNALETSGSGRHCYLVPVPVRRLLQPVRRERCRSVLSCLHQRHRWWLFCLCLCFRRCKPDP